MSGGSERDEHFLRLSFTVARRSLTHGNHPFGCVVVDAEGNALIETENGYMPDHDGTAHAERLAATQACRRFDREVLAKATLYSSAEPCAMCAGAIAHARIARLYYGAADPKGGAVEHGPMLFGQPTVHHRPEIYAGIAEAESAALLRDFFTARR